MRKNFQIKINVDLLDKSKLYKGQKGTYLTLSGVIDDEMDQYGNNGFVGQELGKDANGNYIKSPILGNIKIWSKPEVSAAQLNAKPVQKIVQPDPQVDEDELPF